MAITIGSLVMDLHSTVLTQEEQELIIHPLVGGVILFTRNYQDPKQLMQLCREIRKVKKSPILIMVDQEGGRVQRFVNGFSALPAFAHYGDMYDTDPVAACAFSKQTAEQMARELLAVGIDFSISPVLDLNKGMSTVIGTRAFHRDPKIVATLGRAFIEGMHAAGMASVAKHFPGHGSVFADSHLELPIDERILQEIEQDDLLPFAMLAPYIRGMMASHLLFPMIDKDIVGFSRHWIQTILRERLQFKGAILTDDLHMQGASISAYAPDRFLAAKAAGCDLALYCNDRPAVIQVLDRVPHATYQLPESTWRLLMRATHAQHDEVL